MKKDKPLTDKNREFFADFMEKVGRYRAKMQPRGFKPCDECGVTVSANKYRCLSCAEKQTEAK